MSDPLSIIATAVRSFVTSKPFTWKRLADLTGLHERAFRHFSRVNHDPRLSTLSKIWAVMPVEDRLQATALLQSVQGSASSKSDLGHYDTPECACERDGEARP